MSMTGGCQCGAVRYELDQRPEAEFCHCGMCRRATGGAFAALATVPKTAFRWTKGSPKAFDSSTAARREFCGACGTPLTFVYHAGKSLDVTIGSLDDPEAAGPLKLEFTVESRLSWIAPTEGAKQQRLDEYKDAPVFQPGYRSYQAHPSPPGEGGREAAGWGTAGPTESLGVNHGSPPVSPLGGETPSPGGEGR